ncbi:MAG: NAD(P)/FAD-dependent oxidoreductase [Lachnospiraceae bacterium]|nr:NAD(P)/FAD-dependent oxidoreductase [Lachnospiraceae bacterium]
MSKVFVIGGGASGMMAAIAAADNYNEVHLIEKNEKLGKKIFITGKGRCNVTNASDMNTHLNNVVSNPKFLYSAFNAFTSEDLMELIETTGIKLKIERGQRVFPVSDHSSDIIKAFTILLKERGVNIHLNTKVVDVKKAEKTERGNIEVKLGDGRVVYCDSCIVATGGCSYPVTGSDGDGYVFARENGHDIVETHPALVPLNIKEEYCKELQGLSLKNVKLSIFADEKMIFSDMGEMLFTHFGISGPLVLTASSLVTDIVKNKKITAVIDLKPALSKEQLDKRLLRDFSENINKNFKNSIDGMLPKKMIPIIIRLSGIEEDRKVNEITKTERERLVELLKNMNLTVTSTRGFNEAIITKGGVDIRDISPKNMESKLVPGLFFVGEVLDLDSFTGGYNLQIAWSTGYAAGNSIW